MKNFKKRRNKLTGRCNNCGDFDHRSDRCLKPRKCFRCKSNKHSSAVSLRCPKLAKAVDDIIELIREHNHKDEKGKEKEKEKGKNREVSATEAPNIAGFSSEQINNLLNQQNIVTEDTETAEADSTMADRSSATGDFSPVGGY